MKVKLTLWRTRTPGIVTHRYWRLYFANPSPGNVYPLQVAEVEMYSSIGGADVCVGGTASASEEFPGQIAAYAFDGNASTYWGTNSNTNDKWLKYAFNSAVDIVQFRVANEASGWVQQVKLQYSDDDATWTDVGVTMQAGELVGGAQTYIPAGSKSYWRLYCTAASGWFNLRIAEFEFRLTVGGADVSIPGQPGRSSATAGGTTSADAVDNNTGTEWVSAFSLSGPYWIWFAFDSDKDVHELRVVNGSATDQAPQDFLIQHSGDGANWTTAKTVTGETGWSAGESRTYSW